MERINRWVYAVAGVLILLLAGLVYAWSILSGPISAEFPQWSKAQLSLTFTIVMGAFCVGCLIAGFLAAKIDPRVLCLCSAALFLGGFFAASRMQSLMELYLSFGVICGLASGLVYNVVMSNISKRFADRQGLISGVLLMGFGISSFLIGKLYQMFTPDAIGAWRSSFLIIGIVACVVLVVCSPFMRRPQTAPPAKSSGRSTAQDVPTGRMLRTPAFWLYYLWAILLSAAGLALVSQASGIAREVGAGVSPGAIATVVGLISIANGVGRVILGSMFDRRGRQTTMMLVNLLFIITAALLIVALRSQSFTLIVIGFVVGGLGYGGVTPTNSAFISARFGQKHYPVNFSCVNTNLMIASFGSTIAGALFDVSQSYFSTYILMLVLAVLGIAVTYGIQVSDRQVGCLVDG